MVLGARKLVRAKILKLQGARNEIRGKIYKFCTARTRENLRSKIYAKGIKHEQKLANLSRFSFFFEIFFPFSSLFCELQLNLRENICDYHKQDFDMSPPVAPYVIMDIKFQTSHYDSHAFHSKRSPHFTSLRL